MPRSQVSNYIWTPKRDLLLLRMRDGPGHYTWEETVERLGPTCHVPGAMNRYGCLQRGMVGTDPWDERKEQELVRLLATGYTIFAIQVMMRLPLYFIRRRIVIVKENAEQAALEVKQRQFLDNPLQWGGREDEVLLRLDIALMEPADIQLLGLFGKITLTFIRERIALHRDPRSELYRRLLELYNRRLGIERITRWTIEDVLNGHFEF
ncbi:hypothetical protein SLS60_006018 [Paraconiothyrium brasiliense]|uniref:Uncharacterized protein n=1 Tax=Paraconiothyrium brasiliense TaxID=300254 RepID=A0ABR3RE15_9PLEO